MERGSVKHTARIDDQKKRESEALERGAPNNGRIEEFKDLEGAAGDDQMPHDMIGGGRDPDAPTLTHEETEARREIARWLDTVVWPASRDTLIENARLHHAPEPTIQALSVLPADQQFENVQDVWTQLGGPTEQRG